MVSHGGGLLSRSGGRQWRSGVAVVASSGRAEVDGGHAKACSAVYIEEMQLVRGVCAMQQRVKEEAGTTLRRGDDEGGVVSGKAAWRSGLEGRWWHDVQATMLQWCSDTGTRRVAQGAGGAMQQGTLASRTTTVRRVEMWWPIRIVFGTEQRATRAMRWIGVLGSLCGQWKLFYFCWRPLRSMEVRITSID
jgi:hypothetical protein